MSSDTRSPESDAGPPPAPAAARAALPLQLALAALYPLCAHLAGLRGGGVFAALACIDVAAMALATPLLVWRGWAWLTLIWFAGGAFWLAATEWALLPLLLMPAVFMLMIAWLFARSLRPPRQPLIGRIVAALDGVQPQQLPPDISRYTRRLTMAWAGLLGLLALANLGLALVATPRGVLAAFAVAAPFTVTQAQWSWFANVLNHGLIGGFFLLEYAYRKRRFPARYASFADFVMRMARLGPTVWQDLLR